MINIHHLPALYHFSQSEAERFRPIEDAVDYQFTLLINVSSMTFQIADRLQTLCKTLMTINSIIRQIARPI